MRKSIPNRHHSVPHTGASPRKASKSRRSAWSKFKSKCKRKFKQFKENCDSFARWSLRVATIVTILICAYAAISHGDIASTATILDGLAITGSFLSMYKPGEK